jgi:hypothetical protein
VTATIKGRTRTGLGDVTSLVGRPWVGLKWTGCQKDNQAGGGGEPNPNLSRRLRIQVTTAGEFLRLANHRLKS